MGTLKDEMRGVSEDRLRGEKAGDGEDPGSSDGTAVTDASHENTGVESTETTIEPEIDHYSGDTCVETDATVNMERQSISVAVPSTPDPTDLRSPAPFGQHHMRTQVSLEVVQCHSAATSPMTPPEGGHNSSFFFPSSFGKREAVGTDTKDAELQVGQQVEYSSIATSPMTPRSPFFSNFLPLQCRESAQKKSEDSQGCQVATINPPESEIRGSLKSSSSKESEDLGCSGTPESSANCPAGVVMISEGKPQRMGSMDQDITILVTQHGNAEEDEDKTHSNVQGPIDTAMVKLEEEGEKNQRQDEKADQKSKIKTQEAPTKVELKSSHSLEAHDPKDVVPESPAPSGCHNMRTQVSLEVVQCHSAATSPMTPPEGDQAFCFPSVSCGGVGTETKDAELQVGQQVEYRSVATAPMTPRTPTATIFPEITKCPSIEERIVEEEEEKDTLKDEAEDAKGESEGSEESERSEGSEGHEESEGSEGNVGSDGSEGGEGGKENQGDEENKQEVNSNEDKSDEPVQEVSWDEKGMTWEVYGAVVEVSVLGSAIQKHLEKQVKKQKKPTLPPPPPLNPSATPLSPPEASPRATGSGKGRGKRAEKPSRRRRNPFRQMMENIQQPHCCSRAHTTE